MNGFLVMGIGTFDVPLAIFKSRSVAMEYAEDVTAAEVSAAIHAAWRQVAVDPSPISVVLVPIVGGEPQPFEVVKSFEE